MIETIAGIAYDCKNANEDFLSVNATKTKLCINSC